MDIPFAKLCHPSDVKTLFVRIVVSKQLYHHIYVMQYEGNQDTRTILSIEHRTKTNKTKNTTKITRKVSYLDTTKTSEVNPSVYGV